MLFNNDRIIFLSLIILFIISIALNYLIIKIAPIVGFVSKPNPIVKNHKSNIAFGGGVAIFLPFIFLFYLLDILSVHENNLWIIISTIFLLGISDDIIQFSPIVKFILQIITVFIFFLLNADINLMHFILFYVLLLLSYQNSFNLIDIMDGLAASVSLIAFFGASILFSIYEKEFVEFSFINLSIAVCIAGFLIYNLYPAKIFLGDSGSLTLGMLYGVNVVHAFETNFVFGILILINGIVPLFEMVFLIIVRVQKKIPFYRGSPDHFALRMLHSGLEVSEIILRVASVSILISVSLIIITIYDLSFFWVSIFSLFILIAAIQFFFYFKRLKTYTIAEKAK